MANSNSLQQIQIHRGNSKLITSKSNSPRQIQIRCGNFEFTTANSSSLLQIQIHHVKFKIMTANSVSQQCRHGLQGKGGRGTGLVFILFLLTVKYLHKVCFKW